MISVVSRPRSSVYVKSVWIEQRKIQILQKIPSMKYFLSYFRTLPSGTKLSNFSYPVVLTIEYWFQLELTRTQVWELFALLLKSLSLTLCECLPTVTQDQFTIMYFLPYETENFDEQLELNFKRTVYWYYVFGLKWHFRHKKYHKYILMLERIL